MSTAIQAHRLLPKNERTSNWIANKCLPLSKHINSCPRMEEHSPRTKMKRRDKAHSPRLWDIQKPYAFKRRQNRISQSNMTSSTTKSQRERELNGVLLVANGEKHHTWSVPHPAYCLHHNMSSRNLQMLWIATAIIDDRTTTENTNIHQRRKWIWEFCWSIEKKNTHISKGH